MSLLSLLLLPSIITTRTADAWNHQHPKVLPSLSNATDVGVVSIPLTDKNRWDPFTNYTSQRQIMISLFYPAGPNSPQEFYQQYSEASSRYYTIPYMPPTTAALYDELGFSLGFPNNTFEQLSTFCQLNAAIQDNSMAYSLLIFSPGGGASRFFYTTILEDLARRGYIVAAIDHPYDALVVEFPDGRTILGLNKTLTRDEVELLVKVRAQDISLVIDELSRRYPGKINTTDIVALGHSLGGNAVAAATLNDTRIKGGINVDGRIFDSIDRTETTISKPFIQFVSELSSSHPIWQWDKQWKHLCGWKLELVLNGSSHITFTDLPLIAEAFHLRGRLGEIEDELLGKMQGVRGLEIMVEYASAFAEFVLTGKHKSLLQSEGNDVFPEVIVRRQG